MMIFAEELIRDHFRPLGVVIGSEKQGGQHQGSNTAVTWPVAFIVTISINGKNENLCNYWRGMNISSGSELGFNIQMQDHSTYSLNFSKQLITKSFGVLDKPRGVNTQSYSYPQICPCKNHDFVTRDHNNKVVSGRIPTMGYWHVCMPQMMHQKVTQIDSSNNAASFHLGAVLQSTISITWVNSMWTHAKRESDRDTGEKLRNMSTKKNTAVASVFVGRSANVRPQYLTTTGNPRAVALDARVNTMTQERNASHCGVVRKTVPLTDAERLERGFSTPVKVQRVSAAPSIVSIPPINSEIVVTEAIDETTLQQAPTTKRAKVHSKKRDSSLTTATESTITRL
ncbi:hypothetical protein T484DRAFT_3637357 [Baffinella frigidus]|nr:hypothetical protein T484DRAFT_3637357 [Cryptophyta sp. CCMP2293]